MYADRADKRQHRVNLSINDEHKQRFMEEARARRMQVTPTILELALEGLKWRELHAANFASSTQGMRRANA